MFSNVFFLCLVFATASSLTCDKADWRNGYREGSEAALNLIETMANDTTESKQKDNVIFPNHLYKRNSKASAEHKLGFTIQVLEEVSALFKEDHSSASWEQITVEHFLMAVTRQVDSLRSCVRKHHTSHTLHNHFKSLSSLLEQRGHDAKVWEQIRRIIIQHLHRVDLTLSPILASN